MRRQLRRACGEALQRIFGVPAYRPGQKAAASCLLEGRDLLCILPTGAGKSLCWQLPAVVHEGLTVVVSPLIALMHDQAASLWRRGVPAETIDSLMSPEERRAAENRLRAGESRILIVSPERLETPSFRRLCCELVPWLLVVDEAHCVVEWGEEFRPAYARIGAFISGLPQRPVLCAMTATADARMQRQIVSSLGMQFHRRVMLPVVRPNLVYSAVTAADSTRAILRIMRASPCRTVVFCRSRERTQRLAGVLCREGFAADFYHAGLGREARAEAMACFSAGETQILAATTAFGMGVDIPDIRRVIFDVMPESITALAQQAGRAGRDGADAECIVLVTPWHLLTQNVSLHGCYTATGWFSPDRWRMLRGWWRPLKKLMRLLLCGECIPAGIAAAFGQRVERCGRCSACLRGPLAGTTPDLMRWRDADVRAWLLVWQRDALAKQRGVAPQSLISDRALADMAHCGTLPPIEDGQTRQAFTRLMDAFAAVGTRGKGLDKVDSGNDEKSA